jgi:hypothetical protein
MVDRFGATMTTVPKFPTLDNISTEEATERLNALMQEREQLFRSAQLNPNAYEKMPASQHSQRTADRERILCLKDLRISVRDGNTTGLFTRYLQHQNRVNQKNVQQDLQAQNDGLNRNNEVQQAKQNPEAGNVQMG